MPSPETPPTTWHGMVRHLGPGLIIAAVIVGSGELIVTPKLGATVGFSLLWFIVLGCLLKVFVQVELGRYAIGHGQTTLEAMNRMPGPRLRVSWLVWLWTLMYVATVFQVGGMVGGIAEVLRLSGLHWPWWVLGLGTVIVCAGLLITGRYRLVERVSALLVALFTCCTMLAVGALQGSPYAVTWHDLAQGWSFRLPENAGVAFAAFGIIGVGASELIYYPYWCLEKGYAARVGPQDATPQWLSRARGWIGVMKVDAWVSLVIYTLATVAFYVLGAAVLFGKGMDVENVNMIETLSHMYRESLGPGSLALFLTGAAVVLFSTVFGATASNARLFADALSVFGVVSYRDPEQRVRMVKAACVGLPLASFLLYAVMRQPVTLVFVGAIAQGFMLPFLAVAALYFRFRQTDPDLKPGRCWTFFLIVSALAMMALGIYQVWNALSKG